MVAPFLDLGQVWNSGNNPNILASENFLMGVGLGLLWEVAPGWNIRLDYGYPIINLPDRGNNAQDDGFYFSVNVEL
jgi:hemolysin activation/secretion protein